MELKSSICVSLEISFKSIVESVVRLMIFTLRRRVIYKGARRIFKIYILMTHVFSFRPPREVARQKGLRRETRREGRKADSTNSGSS